MMKIQAILKLLKSFTHEFTISPSNNPSFFTNEALPHFSLILLYLGIYVYCVYHISYVSYISYIIYCTYIYIYFYISISISLRKVILNKQIKTIIIWRLSIMLWQIVLSWEQVWWFLRTWQWNRPILLFYTT